MSKWVGVVLVPQAIEIEAENRTDAVVIARSIVSQIKPELHPPCSNVYPKLFSLQLKPDAVIDLDQAPPIL